MRLLHRDQTDDSDARTDEVRVAPAGPDGEMTAVDRPATARDGDVVVDRDRDRPVVADRHTVRERTWTFAPGQIVSFAAGVALLVVGLVALLRAGIDGSFATPTVQVLGYSHTAWLGLAEVGLGLLLVLAGSGAWGRPLSVLLGAATVVAGILVLAEPDQMPAELGVEKAFGWPLVILGAVVALAAMTLPVWRRRTVTDDQLVDLRSDRVESRA